MNFVDRAVAFVSPVAGIRRQAARRMLERSAPAARSRFAGRSERDFYVNTGNPNDARPKRLIARQTILQLVAENPFARKALNALLNGLVAWGVTGAPQGSKALRTAWAEWIKVCDWYGRHDLYGLQELFVRSMLRDGEVFIVKRTVKVPSGIPLRIQLLDKGMLATHKVGDNIERGIEYDADKRPVAYHFVKVRPGSAWFSSETIRFPADEVVHLFHGEWIGQTEGVSIFESVVKRLGDIEEGIEAEVVKANISACMVGFRYRPPAQEGEDPNIGMPTDGHRDGPPVEEFVPGMIETLEDGEQITFSNPPKTGGIGELARIALLAAAAGTGVTVEQISGDVSQVNFSSFKAGHLEYRRQVGRIQYLTIIPIGLDRIWAWFLGTGIDFGQFPNKPVPIKWTPPPFESIDRKGEAEADILEMQAGLESRPNLLNSRGFDAPEMMDQIAEHQALLKKLSLAFKGDPFTPAQTATTDPTAPGAADRDLMLRLARRLLVGTHTDA
ncbi:phage portal protein [Sphingomonas sp.]|uniref:phage portal protein n=1 Tax=Sphingomonas sp. TaxID=28214 RepID=UPI003AFFE894